jgi:hypothetical protein
LLARLVLLVRPLSRGVEAKELIFGVELLSRAALPAMCAEHAVVSLW